MKKGKWHMAWLVLLGVILIRGFAGGGINMTSGLFLAPVSEEIGAGIGSLSIYFSITSIVLVLILPTAGKWMQRYDVRWLAVIGAVLQTLSFAAFGFLHSVYGWYLLAIPQAIGAAIIVNLLGPVLINRWFAQNAGMMMGIQMFFVGIFGAILQPVTSTLIAQDGWRRAYLILGSISFIAVLLSAFFLIKNRPEDHGLRPYGGDASLGQPGDSRNQRAGMIEIAENEAVHSASFYLLLFFMVAITGVGVFTQHIPTYGGGLGYTVEETGRALAFASVGSALGSIAIGVVCDKIGSLKTCFGMIGLGLVAVAGFFFSSYSLLLFNLSTFLHGLVSSGIMVLAPILTLTFYGQRDYEKIYAKVAMGAPLSSILLIPVYGFIYDMMKNYIPVFVVMLVLLCLAAFCIAVGWQKRCTANGCPGFRRQ